MLSVSTLLFTSLDEEGAEELYDASGSVGAVMSAPSLIVAWEDVSFLLYHIIKAPRKKKRGEHIFSDTMSIITFLNA